MARQEMRVLLINRSLYKDDPWSIHRQGCSDVAKDKRDNWGRIDGYFASVELAIASIEEDPDMIEMGYGRESIHVYPCTKG